MADLRFLMNRVIGQEVKDPAVNFNRPWTEQPDIAQECCMERLYRCVDENVEPGIGIYDHTEYTVYDNPFSHSMISVCMPKLKICTWADTDEMSRFDDETGECGGSVPCEKRDSNKGRKGFCKLETDYICV